MKKLAEELDNDCETGQGKESELPVASTRGRLFFITEGINKGLWWDTGTTWTCAGELHTGEILSTINEINFDESITPSIEHSTYVNLVVTGKTESGKIRELKSLVTIGTKTLPPQEMPEVVGTTPWTLSNQFIVPKGIKYKVEPTNASKIQVCYLEL